MLISLDRNVTPLSNAAQLQLAIVSNIGLVGQSDSRGKGRGEVADVATRYSFICHLYGSQAPPRQ